MQVKNSVRNLQRWRQVQAILLRYGFDMLIDRDEIKEVRRFLHSSLHLKTGEFQDRSVPEKVRLMLQELGPTYVKLGQVLASRRDLLPARWTAELATLQDDVPPFPAGEARAVIESELGAPLDTLVANFDDTPIAAASIGQVHRAKLLDRRPVVVKVQRPGIQPKVQADMEIMREIARLLEARTSFGKQYNIVGIIDEFERSLRDELDYQNEARNADRLRQNLVATPGIRVPAIYWELVTGRVLTMEAVRGIKINDLAALDAAAIKRQPLADLFIRTICRQILVDGFFHADPHPGNVYVDPADGTLILLDLGMMGELLDDQRADLGDLVLAIQRRDTREIVRLALHIGTRRHPISELALRRDLERLLNRYLSAELASISVSQLLNQVVATLFEHGIQLPSNLTLAIKTLLQAEEIARLLDPTVQLVEILGAVVQEVIRQRLAPANLARKVLHEIIESGELLHQLPRTTSALLQQVQDGELSVKITIPDLPPEGRRLTILGNQLTVGLVLAGMVIGSALAMGVSPQQSWGFIPLLGVIGFIGSMVGGGVIVSRALMDIWQTRRKK